MALIKNRQILFSNREQYLGTTYDHSSNHMVFRTERINEDGIDLADMVFKVVLKYSDTSTTDNDALTVDVSDQYIDIIWTIASSVMTHEGTHLIQIQAFEQAGTFKWSTFVNTIYIENALTSVPSSSSLSELETLESRINQSIATSAAGETSRNTAESARVSAENARVSAETARVSAENARVSAENARVSAETERQEQFEEDEDDWEARVASLESGYSATSLLAKSYAVGGTGTRAGEDTDNAKYYKEQAQSISVGSLNYEEEKIYFGDTDSSTDGGDVSRIVALDPDGVAKVYELNDSEARTSALNAQDTADSAVSNAAAAQSTANTAVSNAAAAQSTANTAVTNAATAQSTADTAVSNAAAAQSTANTAVTNAATAQGTANTAVTNAATAQSKADSAYGLAEAAVPAANVVNNLVTTEAGYVADARTVSTLNQNLTHLNNRVLVGSGTSVDISSVTTDMIVAVKGVYNEIAVIYVPFALKNNEFIVSSMNVAGVHNSWMARVYVGDTAVSVPMAYTTGSDSFVGTAFTPTIYVYA